MGDGKFSSKDGWKEVREVYGVAFLDPETKEILELELHGISIYQLGEFCKKHGYIPEE